jgi:hypothetical protein
MSAYGIGYHRRILLDNIATFWILLSLYLLVGRVTLRRVWLSAVAIGIAVLSKEVALAAIPPLAVLVARQSPRSTRVFAVVGWLGLALSITSIYILMALLKGEFFPAGSLLGGDHRHVSLLCSLQWQSSRAADGGLLDSSSAFWGTARNWAHQEPLLVLGGTGAAGVAITVWRRRRIVSMLGWTVLSLWLFFGRGGVVLPFYLVPLLPLLALTLALTLGECVTALRHSLPSRLGGVLSAGVLAVALVSCGLLVALGFARAGTGLWTGRPVDGQVEAVRWVERHIPPSSRLVIDQYMWRDLHAPPRDAPVFGNAQYYWTVGEDPQLRRRVFDDDWRNVDYVITTPQLTHDTRENGFALVAPALQHSVAVAVFDTGGWRVEVRRVDPSLPAQLRLPAAPVTSVPTCMQSFA